MSEVKVGEDGIIAISGNVTIANLEELYKEMSKIYNETQCTAIDMTEVVEIDTAGLQMLLSFVKSFQEIGTEIKCIINPVVQEILTLTGLTNRFCLA